jgi:hypothetical protein
MVKAPYLTHGGTPAGLNPQHPSSSNRKYFDSASSRSCSLLVPRHDTTKTLRTSDWGKVSYIPIGSRHFGEFPLVKRNMKPTKSEQHPLEAAKMLEMARITQFL